MSLTRSMFVSRVERSGFQLIDGGTGRSVYSNVLVTAESRVDQEEVRFMVDPDDAPHVGALVHLTVTW